MACTDVFQPVEVLPGAAARLGNFPDLVELLRSKKSKVDFMTREEEQFLYLVPSVAVLGVARRLFKRQYWIRDRHDGTPGIHVALLLIRRAVFAIVVAPVFACAAVCISLPAWAYRWSIKGTCLLLFPLVFLVGDAPRTKPEHITASLVAKSAFGGSVAVVLLLASRGLQALVGDDVMPEATSSWYTKITSAAARSEIMRAFFPPDRVPVWQVLIAVSAAVVFFSYLYAGRLKSREIYGPLEQQIFAAIHVLLGVLVVAIIFSLIYISSSLVP